MREGEKYEGSLILNVLAQLIFCGRVNITWTY